MRICHVTNVHGPFDGRIFHKMACSAAKYGHQVFLVAPHDKSEVVNDVEIVPIEKSKNRIKRFIDTHKLKKILLNIDADIYHFHDPELIPIMLTIHSTKHKVIYDIHEFNREAIATKNWIPKMLRQTLSQLAWMMEKKACREFECTIAATAELAEVYTPYSNRSEYIWNFDFKRDINVKVYSEFLKDIVRDVGFNIVCENFDYVVYPDYLENKVVEVDNLVNIPSHNNISKNPFEKVEARYSILESLI